MHSSFVDMLLPTICVFVTILHKLRGRYGEVILQTAPKQNIKQLVDLLISVQK